jgi:hypothetical protein
MKISRKLVKEAGLHPKLKLMVKDTNEKGNEITVSTGKHTVELIADKEVMGKDPNTGKPTPYVRYLVKNVKNGQTYTYDTRKFNKDTGELSYLVQNLSDYDEGTIVVMQAKKIGAKNYISVKQATGMVAPEKELHDEEDEELEDVDELEEAPDEMPE